MGFPDQQKSWPVPLSILYKVSETKSFWQFPATSHGMPHLHRQKHKPARCRDCFLLHIFILERMSANLNESITTAELKENVNVNKMSEGPMVGAVRALDSESN